MGFRYSFNEIHEALLRIYISKELRERNKSDLDSLVKVMELEILAQLDTEFYYKCQDNEEVASWLNNFLNGVDWVRDGF